MSGSPRRAAGVAEQHRAFIDRMELMYEYLIGEGYVRHMDIQVPPHGLPKDPVDVINLRGAGLEPDTIELIGILPCFNNYANAEHRIASRSEYDIPIAPGCAAVSYLVNSFLPEDFRDVASDERMPPTTFKIATAIPPAGWNIAYDMQKSWSFIHLSPIYRVSESVEEANRQVEMITKWPLNGWASRHDVSVEDFFSDWAQHVKSGEWVFSATPACFLRTIQVRPSTGTNGHAHDNGH